MWSACTRPIQWTAKRKLHHRARAQLPMALSLVASRPLLALSSKVCFPRLCVPLLSDPHTDYPIHVMWYGAGKREREREREHALRFSLISALTHMT